MSATEIAWGDAQAVERWSSKLARETVGKCYFKKFLGKSEDSIIQLHTDLSNAAGDVVKYDVLMQNRGDGTQGDTTLEGNEEALEMYQDSVNIDQLRHAHNFRRMTQKRTIHNLRTLGKTSLSNWFAWKFDTLMFAYLAGVAGDGAESASGTLGSGGFAGNALQVSDATHHHDQTGGVMTLQYLDDCVTLAKTIDPLIRPIKINGESKYVAVLHPYSVRSLKLETGEKSWNMIHQRVAENGSKNPIYTGALGEHNGVVIHECEFIPTANAAGAWSGAAANDKANLFLGAQAGCFAMGNGGGAGSGDGGYFSWEEQAKDYKNNKGLAAGSIFGMKKTRFNSLDFGVLRLTTTDAAPS